MMKNALFLAVAAMVVSDVSAAHEDRCSRYCATYLGENKCNGGLPNAAVFNPVDEPANAPNTTAENQACMNQCASFALDPNAPAGYVPLDPDNTAEITSGNSFECRWYHATAAGANEELTVEVHCPHGSPVSENADGTNGPCTDSADNTAQCETYCKHVTKFCPTYLFGDEAACLATCQYMPAGEASDTYPLAAPTSGDSVSCRRYHLSVAAGRPAVNTDFADAETLAHCPHATYGRDYSAEANLGTDAAVCGTQCELYCDVAMGACTGDNALYADRTECLFNCGELPRQEADFAAGAGLVTSGDTAECRLYHLTVAAQSAENANIHCRHAASVLRNPGGPCGGDPAAADEIIEGALPAPSSASAVAPAMAVALAVGAVAMMN